MIISHRHRFIFIKTEKTAGTSIELALAKLCGPDDVITAVVHPADRELRRSLGPGVRGQQNDIIPLRFLTSLDIARGIKVGRRPRFTNHMSAAEIRRFVPREVWNGYYKFCVERNPWDKAISVYAWWRELESQFRRDPAEFRRGLGASARGVEWMIARHPIGDMTVSQFVQSGRANLVQGHDLYTIDGEVVVDRLLRFERLAEEMTEVARHLGIDDLPPLPRAKSGIRAPGVHYRDLLDDGDRAKIGRVFAREIALLGYEF
ncbi:MAG: hypothetical protein ACO4CP_08905 [Steroidobacteraceae bacterium]